MAAASQTIVADSYEAILRAKQKQIDELHAQLRDYNNACQRLENALIQEQLRSQQLLDDVNGYKALLAFKDTQLEEISARLNSGLTQQLTPPIPDLIMAEKEVVTPYSQPVQRAVSASPRFSDKEVLQSEFFRGLGVSPPTDIIARSRSFSDKQALMEQSEKRRSRASSAITFDALGVPTIAGHRRRADELREPKGYSAKPNLRYFGNKSSEVDRY